MRALASLAPPPRWLAAVLLLALAGTAFWLRLYRLDALSFWLDETASVSYAELAPAELWGADNHPPLFYLLLHYWLPWAGYDEGRLRLLTVLLSLAALPAVWLAGRRIGGAWVGYAAAFVLACHAFDVRYAQELRMYALLNCAAAWALFGFVTLLADPARAALRIGRGTWLPWTLLGAGTAVALYAQTLAVLLPLTTTVLAIALWWRRPERAGLARNWLLVNGLVLLAWLPFVPEVIRQAAVTTWHWIDEPTWMEVGYTQQQLAFGVPVWDGPWPVVTLCAFALLTIAGWFACPRGSPWRVALPVLALLPALVAIAVSFVMQPLYLARPLIWTEIPVALLVGAGIVAVLSVQSWRLKAAGVLLVLLMAAGNANSLHYHYVSYGKADWRGVAELTVRLAEPGETVLVPYSDFVAAIYYTKRFAEAAGREPPKIYGAWRPRLLKMLVLAASIPDAPQFLRIEQNWGWPADGVRVALRWRFPCHEVERIAEKSGMAILRYSRNEDCAR